MKQLIKTYGILRSLYHNRALVIITILGVTVMILDSSLGVYCTPPSKRIINIPNSDTFLIYSVIFVLVSIYLLLRAKDLEFMGSGRNKALYFIVMASQILFFLIFATIYLQMVTSLGYLNLLVSFVVYSTLLLSASFLMIAAIKFFQWFKIHKNRLVLLYGLVMSSLVVNALFGFFYFQQINLSHNDFIKRTSCRAIFGSLYNVNPELTYQLKMAYDISAIISFLLAWIATVFMLKPYSGILKNLRFLIIVSLPMLFFLSRYEAALYYLFSYQATDILTAIRFNTYLYGSEYFELLLNSNLQLGGIFFALAFIIIGLKISMLNQLKKAIIMSGIGMLFLFGSKDLSPLYYASFPPVGVVAVSFMAVGSYLVNTGIFTSARISSRNSNLRDDLRKRIENDAVLLRNIATSENIIDTEKKVKRLMKLTSDSVHKDNLGELSKEEVNHLVHDIISELKNKSKSPK